VKVGIAGTDGRITYFTKIRNISFAPEVDMSAQSLPINRFTVDIETEQDIKAGQFMYLSSDAHDWACYWITKSERKTPKLLSVLAESILIFFERTTMRARYSEGVSAYNLISECMAAISPSSATQSIVIDSQLRNVLISGFCPEQSARERLQSILFAAGAYWQDWGTAEPHIQFAPIMDSSDRGYGSILQANEVFVRPVIEKGDNASHFALKYYTVTDYEPATYTSTVQDSNGNTYYVKEDQYGWTSYGSGNEIIIGGNMFVDYTSMQSIKGNLSYYYHTLVDIVEADIINNGRIWPGDLITIPIDDDDAHIATGYVQSVDFSFGLQSRSRISIYPATLVDGALVTLKWVCDGNTVCTESAHYPIGHMVSIDSGQKQVLTNAHLYTYEFNGIEVAAARDQTIEMDCMLVSDTDLITGETVTYSGLEA